MFMKRPRSFLLFLVLALALTACGGAPAAATPTAPLPEPDTTPAEPPAQPTLDQSYPAPVLPTITPLPEGYPEPRTPPPFTGPYPAPGEGTGEAPTAPEFDGPPPGLVFEDNGGLWHMTGDGEPHRLSQRTGLEPSPDLSRAAYIEGDDVFVLDLESGAATNVTEGSGRAHYFVIWWPANPELLILGSQGEEDAGPNLGRLTLVNADGSDYEVVGEDVSYAFPEGSPDGSRIAYDVGGAAAIYDLNSGETEPLDLEAYAVSPDGITLQRAASPAWSPDGGSLALMMGIEREAGPEFGEIALGIFDLQASTVQVIHPYETLGRGGWLMAPRWSADGQWVSYPVETGDESRGLWVTAADGSTQQFLGGNAISVPLWHPSSPTIALTPSEAQNDLLLATAPGWQLQTLPLPHTRLVLWVE
jgi:hypothetical protein